MKLSNGIILNWFPVQNGTHAAFPLAYKEQIFAVSITERNLGVVCYDCVNVYAISLSDGTFDLHDTKGTLLRNILRYVIVLGI